MSTRFLRTFRCNHLHSENKRIANEKLAESKRSERKKRDASLSKGNGDEKQASEAWERSKK